MQEEHEHPLKSTLLMLFRNWEIELLNLMNKRERTMHEEAMIFSRH